MGGRRLGRWARAAMLVLPALAVLATWQIEAAAQSAGDFYKDKQVRFIIHSKAGGDYDVWGRLVSRHMSKHIPGNPVMLPVNMPGGGGIIAANFLYNNAPRDGTTIGIIGRNLPFQALTKVDNVRFDPLKFNWLGSPELTNRVCAVTDRSPAKSAQETFEKEVLMGGAGAGTAVSTVPILLNRLLGTKFKLVEGYGGSTDVVLAMERNEVHGVCQSISSFERSKPGWIEAGKMIVLFNMERTPMRSFTKVKVPSIHEFAKTDEQRKILTLFSSSVEFGRPFVAPPEVPADRVAMLRKAFVAALKEPELLKDAEKQQLDIAIIDGEELTNLIKDMMDTPPELIKKMEEFLR